METLNIFSDKEFDNVFKPDAVVRFKLWDKSILLFRRSKSRGYLIPIEMVWAMFNLDAEKEAVRICDYGYFECEAFLWIDTQEINGQDKTLCMDLDAIPYYLSTVPTQGMDEIAAELINRFSIIARAKLADYFRMGRNNLDKSYECLQGLEEFMYDMEKLDREEKLKEWEEEANDD